MPEEYQTCYICSLCASKNGGKWPRGHRATFHGGICEGCGETKMLAEIHDWNAVDIILLNGTHCKSNKHRREI